MAPSQVDNRAWVASVCRGGCGMFLVVATSVALNTPRVQYTSDNMTRHGVLVLPQLGETTL
jgi:hypothetical protein